MNKKLEEYRDMQGESEVDKTTLYGGKKSPIGSTARSYWENQFLGFQQGFNAAIALDLPVKFAEWHQEIECCTQFPEQHPELFDENETEPGYTSHSLKPMKVLFQYYIDNVHKFE